MYRKRWWTAKNVNLKLYMKENTSGLVRLTFMKQAIYFHGNLFIHCSHTSFKIRNNHTKNCYLSLLKFSDTFGINQCFNINISILNVSMARCSNLIQDNNKCRGCIQHVISTYTLGNLCLYQYVIWLSWNMYTPIKTPKFFK